MMRLTLLLASLLLLGGCAAKEVKPWEKERLSEESMQPDGGNPVLRLYQQHVYFSKEGSKGGTGLSAGGCGCN